MMIREPRSFALHEMADDYIYDMNYILRLSIDPDWYSVVFHTIKDKMKPYNRYIIHGSKGILDQRLIPLLRDFQCKLNFFNDNVILISLPWGIDIKIYHENSQPKFMTITTVENTPNSVQDVIDTYFPEQ